jgi:hypothetical protein
MYPVENQELAQALAQALPQAHPLPLTHRRLLLSPPPYSVLCTPYLCSYSSTPSLLATSNCAPFQTLW